MDGIVRTRHGRVLVAVAGSITNMADLPATDPATGLLGGAQVAGVWQVSPGPAHRIASLPAAAVPNGMTLDPHTGQLYVADSRQGVIWRVPDTGGRARPWLTDPRLAPTRQLNPFTHRRLSLTRVFPNRSVLPVGANGIGWHRGALWVDNTTTGALYRTRPQPDGRPGPLIPVATHLGVIDDFTFLPGTSTIVFARSPGSLATLDTTTGNYRLLLGPNPALSTPTAIAARTPQQLDVTNGAYFSLHNPNLTHVQLTGHTWPPMR